MRYFIAFSVLYLATSICSGQELPDFSSNLNEFNLGFNKGSDMDPNTFIGYKHLFSGGAIRAGTEFRFSSFRDGSDVPDYKNSFYKFSPKVGYEFHRWYGRFKFNYGADLVYTYGRYKEKEYQDGSEDVDLNIERIHGVYIRPLLGLSVFVFKSLSISLESFFDIGYRAIDENYPEGDDAWINTKNGFSANLVPLGLLSVNYHF